MTIEMIILYNGAVVKKWKNELGQNCLSIRDGDITIKLIDLPTKVIKAIEVIE